MNTSPNASIRIARRCRYSSRFGIRQPSANSSGGMNSSMKISGSNVTCRLSFGHASIAPNAICISGSGSRNGSTRVAAPDSATVSSRIRTVKTISIDTAIVENETIGRSLA